MTIDKVHSFRNEVGVYGSERSQDAQITDAWAEWLQGFGLTQFVTFTYRPDYWGEGRSFDTAVNRDLRRFLRQIKYNQQYLAVIEDHKSREIPHVHALMQDHPLLDWRAIWHLWFTSRGYFRSDPIKGGAFRYAAKYAMKRDGDGFRGDRIIVELTTDRGRVPS